MAVLRKQLILIDVQFSSSNKRNCLTEMQCSQNNGVAIFVFQFYNLVWIISNFLNFHL